MENNHGTTIGVSGVIALALAAAPVLAQEALPDLTDKCCSYYGEGVPKQLYSFASDAEALGVVKSILSKNGLEPNFTIMASNVPNAAATVIGEERVILYNQAFMHRIKVATSTDWAGVCILAHEIGHHLQGHTLTKEGSNHKDELEADKYSGWVAAKMGATLDQAQIAIATVTSEEGSKTHPPRSARLAAITNGWKQARSEGEVKPSSVGIKVQQPVTPEAETLQSWFTRFWRHQQVDDANQWVSDFDTHVDYCYHDEGLARRSVLMESRRKLLAKYPTRHYRVVSGPTYSEFGSGEKLARLTYAYDYIHTNGNKVAGTANLRLILRRKGSEGTWVIGGYDESVDGTKKGSGSTAGGGTPADIGETVRESVLAFLKAHIKTMSGNDASRWAGMFTERPYYCYAKGKTTRSYLKRDRAKLIDKYRERSHSRLGIPKLTILDNGKRAKLSFEVTYHYRSSAGKFASGVTREDLELQWSGDRWLISRYDEEVIRN